MIKYTLAVTQNLWSYQQPFKITSISGELVVSEEFECCAFVFVSFLVIDPINFKSLL